MNYLAHLLLSDPSEHGMFGNLMADFIKGPDLSKYPPGIQRGIRLHRSVDGFTDRHPFVLRSIHRISSHWGWFSGILIDIYYDHLLASEFMHYSSEPLPQFVDRVHAMLRNQWHHIPSDSVWAIEKLIETRRLTTYATLEGIEDTLFHLSNRIRDRMPRKDIHLDLAMPELIEQHEELRTDFEMFFPQLVAFTRGLETEVA